MNKVREEKINNHLNLHYKECCDHYGEENVWAVMVYGSQNYKLDTPESDLDTKTLLIPSFKDVVLGAKMVSTDIQISDGGLSNVKDYRAMFQNYLKGNINFVETLFTPWLRLNINYYHEFKKLRSQRNLIANARPQKLMHMAVGMANQKYAAFEHPFESKKEVLAQYGYDPKQLHHLCRLKYFMQDYCEFRDFGKALKPEKEIAERLCSLKTDPIPYSAAVRLKEETMKEINEQLKWADEHLPENNSYEEAKEFLDELAVEVFYKTLENK